MKKRNTGFTIIELMIALVIIGVLVSIGLPNYNNYVMETTRSEGQDELLSIMLDMETYRVENMTYTDNLTNIDLLATQPSKNGKYNITARKCKNADNEDIALTKCIELLATAVGSQDDDGDLIYNSQGRQVLVLPNDSEVGWSH